MLRLYKRHNAECLKTLAKKKLTAEKLRTYKGCDCAIWFAGSWNGRTFPRQTLDVTDWATAESLLQERMQTKAQRATGLALTDALDRWYRKTGLAKRAEETLRHHRRIGGQLIAAAERLNIDTMADVGSEVIDALRLEWTASNIEDSTQRTYLNWLGSFFRYAVTEQWIERSPMPPKCDWPPAPDDEDREETLPLDPEGGDANYRRVLAAILAPCIREARGRKAPALRGERLIPLVELMYESGLRISDAIMFRPAKLAMGERSASYTFMPIKTARRRKTFTAFLPLWLANKLREMSALSPGYPFYDGGKREKIAFSVRKELRRVGEVCGVPEVRPHRFRDSFAVNQLNSGTPIEAVSRMLGHSSVTTTEKYYSPFVKSRLNRLQAEYEQSQCAETPANVVAIRQAK